MFACEFLGVLFIDYCVGLVVDCLLLRIAVLPYVIGLIWFGLLFCIAYVDCLGFELTPLILCWCSLRRFVRLLCLQCCTP